MEADSNSDEGFHSARGSVAREASLASTAGTDWHDALSTASGASLPSTPTGLPAAAAARAALWCTDPGVQPLFSAIMRVPAT
jgi:hypothetical protein